MSNYIVDGADLTSVAEAIRAKGGTSGQLQFPQGFVDAVEAIETGGGNDRIQMRGTYFLNTISGLAPDEAGLKFNNLYFDSELHCGLQYASAGRTFSIDFSGSRVNAVSTSFSTSNSDGAITNITADSDPNFILNIANGSQVFRGQVYLKTITAKVIATATTADRTFMRCRSLQFINFVPNKCNMPLPMSDCSALTNAGLVAIANGLVGGVARTVTLHAKPKARCSTIMGTVSQVTEGGTTYDFFTQDDSGTVTLTDFITTVKGWTLA